MFRNFYINTTFLAFAAVVLCLAKADRTVAATKSRLKADTSEWEKTPDRALLDKFEHLCKRIGNNSGNYTLGGIINVIDKTNLKEPKQSAAFLFCKQGDEFYYKLGNTVTINEKDGYVFADYETRRIIVSAKKDVAYDPVLPGLKDMGATIKSENYTINSTLSGDYETISIINEHHVSCKQYSITYNRQSNKITRLYIRMSNFQAPLRTDNEKIVDVSISEWENRAELSKYPGPGNFVKRVNGTPKKVNAYKNFELVQM